MRAPRTDGRTPSAGSSGVGAWVRRRGTVLIGAVLVAAVLAGCSAGTDGLTDDGGTAGYVSGDGSLTLWAPQERGEPVELAGTTFAEEEVDLAAWRGDVVLVNTWYAACPPCRDEAPDLVAVAEDYAESVHLLGVNSTDDAGTALAFERTFAVPYPSLNDPRGHAVAAMQGHVALQAVPTTVLLDRDGRVAARVLGRIDATTVRAVLDDLLAESADA